MSVCELLNKHASVSRLSSTSEKSPADARNGAGDVEHINKLF